MRHFLMRLKLRPPYARIYEEQQPWLVAYARFSGAPGG